MQSPTLPVSPGPPRRSDSLVTDGPQADAEKLAGLEAIIESVDCLVWTVDRDLRYVLLNTPLKKKLRELTGAEIQPGDNMLDLPILMDPAKVTGWKELCRMAWKGYPGRMTEEFKQDGAPIHYEFAVIPVRKGKEVTGMSYWVRDVTQEVMTEQKLRAGEVRFRSLIENSTDIVTIVDAEGRMIYCSPSVEKNFGVPTNEQMGKSVFDYIYPEDIQRLTDIHLDLLQHPGKSVPVLSRAHTREGREIWMEGVVTNLLHTEGVNGIVCNFRDVTERVTSEKRSHQDIMQATIDAQEKEREEIGRELHDNVNQMLNTARLYLECLHGNGTAQEQIIGRSIKTIHTAIEEIRKLSRSMTQSFNKEIGLKLSLEDLAENIRRLAGMMRVDLDFSLPDEQSLDDKLKLTIFRIIQEQLNNVLKHAGATHIDISVRQNGRHLSVGIVDDGRGFDTALKRKGIGISNIINRASLFNGEVTIESSPGQGCRMRVDFPLNPQP